METTTVQTVRPRHIEGSIGDVVSCYHKTINNNMVDNSPIVERQDNQHLHHHHCPHLDINVTLRNKVDPYHELELYLARVIEEIDDIVTLPSSAPSRKTSIGIPTNWQQQQQQQQRQKLTTNKHKSSFSVFDKLHNDTSNGNRGNVTQSLNMSLLQNSNTKDLLESSNSLLKRQDENVGIGVTFLLSPNVIEAPVVQYQDLLDSFGIDDSDSSQKNSNIDGLKIIPLVQDEFKDRVENCSLNSDYNVYKDTNLSHKCLQTCDSLLNDSIPTVEATKAQKKYDAISPDVEPNNLLNHNKKHFENSSSLPMNLEVTRVKDTQSKCCEFVHVEPKNTIDVRLKFLNAEKTLKREEPSNINEKLPNQVNQNESRSHKNNNLCSSLSPKMFPRRPSNGLKFAASGFGNGSIDLDDDVFVKDNYGITTDSKSLDGNILKSAPTTPTSSKKRPLSPFARIFGRRRSPIPSNSSSNDPVLVRVSSLPDEDLTHIFREQLNDSQIQTSTCCMSTKKNKIKKAPPVSPLSFRKPSTQKYNNSGFNQPNTPLIESLGPSDTTKQISPALSRSSSFTWISDCESLQAEFRFVVHSLNDESPTDHTSSHNTVDDDNRSTSSSQDLVQSMDEISSGSVSSNSPDRTSPFESGIGTASPPRSTDRRSVKPSTDDAQNCKDAWKRIRRKSLKLIIPGENNLTDVWIQQENVNTQTNENTIDDDNDEDDEDENVQELREPADSSSSVDDSLPRTKPPRPNKLPLDLTTSSSLSSAEMLEALPPTPSSPSAASLELNHKPIIELTGKSNSAPILENNRTEKNTTDEFVQPPRSQSERQLSEIEAQEACKWLRAAGFPQYAQMYEDYQFPIEVSSVAKDHPFLETDSLQSLYRRLHALNRCANMKLDTHHTHHNHSTSHNKTAGGEDSDEEAQCALSENWTFEKRTRRWSRIVDISQANVERLQAIAAQHIPNENYVIDDQLETEEGEDTMMDNVKTDNIPASPLPDELSPRFRRTGSERLRDGAKALLRRVESLKSRRRKRQNREGIVISGPQVVDVISMEQKMRDLNCVDVTPTGLIPNSFNDLQPPLSPLHRSTSPLTLSSSPFFLPANNLTSYNTFGDDSSSYYSDGSQSGGPMLTPTRIRFNKAKRFLYHGRGDDQGALSDSECQPSSWRQRYLKDANSNHTKVLEYVNAHSQSVKHKITKPTPINTRGGSLNLGKESQRYRDKYSGSDGNKEDKVSALRREEKLRKSLRYAHDDSVRESKQLTKDVTVYRDKSRSRSSELAGSQESSSTMTTRDSDQDDESPRHKGTVVRWHSFQRGSLYPESLDPLCPRAMASMSCGQLLVLRKLALLKLTACMERYCPTHRTGWNWELPKFIRKIKSPDYKDKTVFGVPLLLSLQRTGQALPKCIQIALRWLRANALDQVGIFRKSGVRSRIQKLKAMTEIQGDNINFDGQQAFDVADLVKQYFRELPEALLTNKLSETFIAIFQHCPAELRPDAVQCVLLLLPDEHREALEALLDFLNHVASNSLYNQMTPSNLAVCLAPSLFHFTHSDSNVSVNRSSSVSPRRRKTVGFPDQRELSENKAAHDCLLYLIKMHRELFMISSDMLAQCHFNYMEESVPVALHELGTEMKQDWRGYMYACTTALLKEAREKSRGWVTVNNPADTSVEVAYKKVGDGHPLRLWRVSTEVEAPPNELLHRVLRERHIWDSQLLKYRTVNKLDANAEIFQYAVGNMSPLPARDYCILRTWRTDLPKDACVVVETSVEHPDASVMLGGTRGIVLASRYLIEKCGSGKSRIMHLSRVDTKGRTPEWYNKSYGHIAALHLSKIRNSFKHTTDGPESKV